MFYLVASEKLMPGSIVKLREIPQQSKSHDSLSKQKRKTCSSTRTFDSCECGHMVSFKCKSQSPACAWQRDNPFWNPSSFTSHCCAGDSNDPKQKNDRRASGGLSKSEHHAISQERGLPKWRSHLFHSSKLASCNSRDRQCHTN